MGKEDAKKAFSKQLAAEAEAEKAAEEEAARKAAEAEVKRDDGVCRIFFDPPHYTVMESVGTFEVTVVREGGDMNTAVQVDYKTEDGTAASPGDYIEAVGTLTFGPGETQKHVTLEVLDDDVFEEDEHFYIRISNLRRKDGKAFKEIEVTDDNGKRSMQACTQMGTPHMATIMILDDDHGGIFGFEDSEAEIVESVGAYECKVQRISGARGKVAIPYNTEDGTAKDGEHYEAQEGELIFCNEETEKTIEIPIMDEESYEKSLIMYVVIGEPRQIAEGKEGEGLDYSILDAKNPEDLTEEEKIALLGRPCLGNNTKLQIRIRESKEFKSSVDKMMQKARRRCPPAATTSCTSSPCHGNLSLLSSRLQQWPMAMLLSSFLWYSSGPVLPSLETLPRISAASSISKTESMPSHLLPWEPVFLIPLPPRLLPLKMRPQTTLLEMLPDPTLSTCSWVSELHGPWPPSTGSPRARPSMSPSEAWDSR